MLLHRVLTFMLAIVSFGWLSVNVPKPLPPVLKWNEHTGARRIYGKALGFGATLRFAGRAFSTLAANFNRLLFGNFGAMQCAGSLNLFLDPLRDFPYQLGADKENMPRSVHLRDMIVTISGTIDINGGTTNGTVNTEAIARLIKRFTIRWDGVDLVQPMEFRDLAALSRRIASQPLSGVPFTSAAIGTTNFELQTIIPFARSYLADPFDTALPPLNVRKEFVVEIEWETSRSNANATTSPGSGALVTGGDRNVVLSNVVARMLPRAARTAGQPWYIPKITAYESAQYLAANPRLVLDIDGNEAFDGVLLRELEGPSRNPVNRISTLSLETSASKIYEEVTRRHLRAIEEDLFHGVLDSAEAGNLFLKFADGGKLGNVLNPKELTLPKFEFNVSAPATNPGVIRAIFMECLSVPGVTRK